MTDKFLDDSYRYLTDDMTVSEREAFEALLRSNESLATAHAELAEGLHAATRQTVAGAVRNEVALASSWAAIEKRLRPETVRPKRSLTWLWPLATAALLVLNLAQFWRRPAPPAGKSPVVTATAPAPTARGVPARAGQSEAERATALAAGNTAGTVSQAVSLEHEKTAAEELRHQCEVLERARDLLIRENRRLANEAGQLLVTGADGSRLVAMELVDSDSYKTGKRNGLLNTARRLLTTPGVVAGMDTNALSFAASAGSGRTAATSNSSLLLTSLGQATLDTSSQPYAWSIYDEAAGEGFINFYDLPEPSTGQQLYLWTRADETSGYVPLGPLPAALDGRSGSVYYQSPTAAKEILVTKEAVDTTPANPSPDVVLRGP